MSRGYYTIVAGLPWLRRFDHSARLPISRERLGRRLADLEPEDARDLEIARAMFETPHELSADERIARSWRASVREVTSPAARRYLEGLIDRRTLLAALRRRQRGEEALGADLLGESPSAWSIRHRFGAPEFGRGPVHPWLREVRELIQQADAVGAERALSAVEWRLLTELAEAHRFRLEEIVAYALKWELTRRWVEHDAEAATGVFRQLIEEVTHGQRPFD